MARLTSQWPSSLTDQRVANGAPANAEIPQVLAGRARWLYEMASGGPAVDGERAGVPPNPQGQIGHDHSGPPYGSAFKHRLFGWSGSRDDIADFPLHNKSTLVFPISTGGLSSLRLAGRVWVRPFVDYTGAPYSKGALVIMARCLSGTVGIGIEIQTNGGAIDDASFTATTTRTMFQIANRVPLRPGWNDISISLSTTSATVTNINSITVHQIAKRSH